ncbi:histidine-containing phosphotransfer protein3 [Zea mays]|uniref:Histidine-containing phosphotransfer protein n=1 Tax=Zea mays TaxID=4577 RepID=A0A1D6PYZ4_MAIZE|nr:histidine-containing phosphotransfer protein3 [Zea mays]
MSAANQLAALVSNMYATGLLDDQFQQLQMLQNASTPDFVSEVVTLFCQDGERIIGELAKLLEKPNVDFDRVDAFVHQLKGSSASIGAQKVKNTCIQFRESCQQKSKDGCLKTLETVKINFYDLRDKFQTMLQILCSVRSMAVPPASEQDGGVELHVGMMRASFKFQNILNKLLNWLLGSL